MEADGHVHYAHLALRAVVRTARSVRGFLNGWTQTGNRPLFKIVTGVSTGALIAPFALLGPQYEAR